MDVARDSGRTRRTRILRRSAFAVVTLSLVVLGLCSLKPAVPEVSASQLWIDRVRRGTLQVQLRGSGVLTPEDVRWVAATTDGRIEHVAMQPGTVVAPGTTLLEISNPELMQSSRDVELQLAAAIAEDHNRAIQSESAMLAQEAVAAAARSDYEEARLRAEADGELAAAGVESALLARYSTGRAAQLQTRVQVEEKRLLLARNARISDAAAARAKVDQLRAAVALRHQQIDALHVRAGLAGVLQDVAVEPGQRVAAGAPLARIAAPQPLKAVISVSEVQASEIAVGQRVEIDLHTATVGGVVARIDPAVKNGSVSVDVRLPRNLPNGARPDLSVDAIVDVATIPNALFVGRPVQAEPNGSLVLFRLTGHSAVRQRVRLGRASYNAIEIAGGLAAGDRVILSDTSAWDRYERITISN